MRILVCDDEEGRSNDIANSIRDGVGIVPERLVGQPLTDVLESLRKGINACIEKPNDCKSLPKIPFDDFDLVVLDNNLAHLDSTGARLTAEAIIGDIRAFTEVPYIISLNKNTEVDFDLRFLVGDYQTRADIALNTPHLSNPALWSGEVEKATNGFLPWYWPRLEVAATRRRNQIDFVRKHLDDSVLTTLGFDDEAIAFLSPHALGALSPRAESDGAQAESLSASEITFRDVFIARDRSLPVQSERELLSQSQKAGNNFLDGVIARSVAADIDFWFRRDVVGPQEPLVDVSHLLLRLPFLLGNRAGEIKEWNTSATAEEAPYGIEAGLYDEHLANKKYELDLWVPNPCFRWPQLKSDEKLNHLFFAEDQNWADVVFCEDRSQFVERERANGDPPAEFQAEFEGSWNRRYVSRIDGIKYAPLSQLAL